MISNLSSAVSTISVKDDMTNQEVYDHLKQDHIESVLKKFDKPTQVKHELLFTLSSHAAVSQTTENIYKK